MELKAEEHAGLAVAGRRRLVGGGGVVVEHQQGRAHPGDSSARPKAARVGPATRARGSAAERHDRGGHDGGEATTIVGCE